jgi:hypothetical protein
LAENLRAMASRLGDLLDPEFRFKPRIAGRRSRGDAHRVTRLRVALSGLGRSKPYDVGRARENSRRCIVKCHHVSMHGGRRDAARLHLAHLERDGVERDGYPGHLYGADEAFGKVGFACARTPSVSRVMRKPAQSVRVAVAPRRERSWRVDAPAVALRTAVPVNVPATGLCAVRVSVIWVVLPAMTKRFLIVLPAEPAADGRGMFHPLREGQIGGES